MEKCGRLNSGMMMSAARSFWAATEDSAKDKPSAK